MIPFVLPASYRFHITQGDDNHMFSFRKKSVSPPPSDTHESTDEAQPEVSKKGWFKKLTSGLGKTRRSLVEGVAGTLRRSHTLDDATLEELETQLLVSDIGIECTDRILADLQKKHKRHKSDNLLGLLKGSMQDILSPYAQPLTIDRQPFVILMVGINGAGKTTTAAKMAQYYKSQGHKVMLAAGDTFRAAAIEQLQAWGERQDIPVITQQAGSDSAAVIFDAMQAATAREYDILIADTAGRLHTQDHLMAELKKIKKVLGKAAAGAPHETMLVVDASLGQNSLQQAIQFHESIGISSTTLTKLDGTAKGGIIFSIVDTLQLPIRFIGVGEGIDDLQPFDSEVFVEALFMDTEVTS